ncbi:MAG: lipid A phosphoethanolamine transferase [Bacteroides sp.]|nr:lipid A phosphoethanolamine transferase [Bacteroides sp.]MCM1379750.1 lipid A phosphoethanolamine transferase [Bacteroides sp.]MCM1445709.1 lipid A phosphoethanolamine transferase [Prevotella sp.]
MKLSDKTSRRISAWLLIGVPLLMLIPNIALAIQSHMGLLPSFANILLPAGLFLFLMSWRNRPGTNVLLLTPFIILACFQIVLLFLYSDGSIIGVDMFLNVATTNGSEAKELLENLRVAIFTVIIIYLPPIILAIVAMRGKIRTSKRSLNRARLSSVGLCISGAIVIAVCEISDPTYRTDEDFYPANVLTNLGTAFHRSYTSRHYHETSREKRYNARSTRPDNLREVYVAVIGETSRADNWQLMGYPRFTTPRLCSLPKSNLAVYGKTLSESNTTHKSVPLLLSTLSAKSFSDSINTSKSVISMFKEAGYKTAYITTQARNGSYIDYFAQEADTAIYIREPKPGVIDYSVYDRDLLVPLDSLLYLNDTKLLVVLHQYGSHFNYVDRYSREEAYFIPDLAPDASPVYRGRLVNAYDNSIRQTDELLYSVISRLDSIGCCGAMIYAADHGEDIYDDSRGRFLHASPTPTYYQLHVPMLLYITPSLAARNPELINQAKIHQSQAVSSSSAYTPTLLHVAGIVMPSLDKSEVLTSHKYREVTRPVFLSDRNRADALEYSGLTAEDYHMLGRLNL